MARMPETRYEMKRAMYELRGTSACKSCSALIEWWRTTNGKMMPFDPAKSPDPEAAEHERAVTHWSTCPNAKQHRAAKTPAPAASPLFAEQEQKQPARHLSPISQRRELTERQTPELLQRETEWFARRHGARCVVTLCGGALDVFTVRDGEDAEDLRNALIAMANAARNHVLSRKEHLHA